MVKTIQDLPNEMLLTIFRYLPSFDNVSLVNKQFYNIAREIWDPNICLKLDGYMFLEKETPKLLQCIKKTNRNITKIELSFYYRKGASVQSMIAIIKKFSATIKYVQFDGCLYLSEIHEILSSVPNAEHLIFDYVAIINNSPQKKRRIMPDYKDLNLPQVKKLKFRNCDDEFVALFNKLPAGVLTEFIFDNSSIDELNVLFAKQTNIKKLTINNEYSHKWLQFPENVFDNLQLEHLAVQEQFGSGIENILIKQTKLHSLKLGGFLEEDLLSIIVNYLTELKTLAICGPYIPVHAIENIETLRNVHATLKYIGRDITNFEAFADSDNSRITTLDIRYVHDFSDGLIAAFARSVPNLKALRFNCIYNFRIFNETMKRFNFVESLIFDPLHEILNYDNDQDSSTLMEGDFFNPNLTELQINYQLPFKRPFLKKLIFAYPNLKKLVVQPLYGITSSQFTLILNGFKKMESLTIQATKLRLGDLNVLIEQKNNLKFILLGNLKSFKITDPIKRNLRKKFGVVNCNYGQLKMAIDGATMETEGKKLGRTLFFDSV